MHEILGTGLAALCLSLAAYVLLRWREAFARAAFRERQKYLAAYVPRRVKWLRVAIAPPYRVQLIGTMIVGLAFAALGALMWACFLGGVVAAIRGELPPLAPPKQGVPAVRPPLAALAALAAISAGLLWAGGRMLVHRNEAARYHEWLFTAGLPLDAPYPRKGDPDAVPPSQRSICLTTAWAVVVLLCGLMVLWLGLRAFLSL